MNRRKIRRYRKSRGNSGMKLVGFLGIMIAAVICGYLTARFVIAPLLGYDTEVLKLDFPSKLMAFLDGEDDADVKEGEKEDQDEEDAEGYALQYGLFSTRDRAEKLVEDLTAEGIDASVKEIDGKYKVISPLLDTKEKALEKLKKTESDRVGDIFITAIK